MDRFIAQENIKRFREHLWSESNPDVRSRYRSFSSQKRMLLACRADPIIRLLAEVEMRDYVRHSSRTAKFKVLTCCSLMLGGSA